MNIPTYDKEGWFKVCRECKPELTREEFEMKWVMFVQMANFMGLWRPM